MSVVQAVFDPFSMKNEKQWLRLMSWFDAEVLEIEGEAKLLIDKSFQTLRSAKGAFALLQMFRDIKSREAISNLLMHKFRDILLQYQKEVC